VRLRVGDARLAAAALRVDLDALLEGLLESLALFQLFDDLSVPLLQKMLELFSLLLELHVLLENVCVKVLLFFL